MLSESFFAATLASSKTPGSSTLKDVGVSIHELQPSPAFRSGFKKSSSSPNCLAVSPSHVFAAQAEKAVVHVYSRERGGQEATIAFPERIRSLAIAGAQGKEVLVLGTEGGRLILWETCTGRQVSTSASHLQPVTALVVDATSNFILSGSPDANIHAWSISRLLSFSKPSATGRSKQPANGPFRTFLNHRAPITSLAVGHGSGRASIAISAAKDNTAIVWDYQTGQTLRTFLLPSVAQSLAVDPADRAFYAGYEDGSIQIIDFYKNASIQHPLHDASLQSTPAQLSAEERWLPPSGDSGAAECLTLSYDGMTLLSGHRSGKVLSWNIAKGKYASTVTDLTHPVTNLLMLPPSGLQGASTEPKVATHNIVKPRYDPSLADSTSTAGIVPADYTFNTHILSSSSPSIISSAGDKTTQLDLFSEALTHPSFPASLIEEGLAELSFFEKGGSNTSQPQNYTSSVSAERTSTVSDAAQASRIQSLESELAAVKQKLLTSETARRSTSSELLQLQSDLTRLKDHSSALQQRQERSEKNKLARRARKEERERERREAWFAAEKNGKNGDRAMRKTEIDNGAETSDTGDLSSEDE
ncbi:hypothetical protein DTO212C5_166 [Paecilomyces variotii]|nr:hypothetical protein DTO212C5_166 [Paecilomyces variotii]